MGSPESGWPDTKLRGFVDRHRSRCLWFLREDYYPTTPAEYENVLRHIERHGDLGAFREAAAIRAWLSHRSSDPSASS